MRHSKPLGTVALAVLAFVAAAVGACTSARTAGDRPLAVIDAHVRTSLTGAIQKRASIVDSKAELAAEMIGYDVVGAVAIDRPGEPPGDLSGLDIIQCVGLAADVDLGPS
jgi:hypothetical protein